MNTNRLRKRLLDGETLLGVCQMYPGGGIIEGMCPGWDFVWIDAQHGQLDLRDALDSVRAAQLMGIETVVRVPGHEAGLIGTYADLAPSALMVPLVNTAQQAEAIVRAMHFPPRGTRSFGGRRPIDLFGIEYYRAGDLALLAQIETVEGAKNAEAIARVEGVDVLFFGGDDMRISMGQPVDAPPPLEAMAAVAAAARAAGKVAGCVSGDPNLMRKGIEMGYRVFVGAADIGFLLNGSRQKLAALREIQQATPQPAPRRSSTTYG